LEQPVGLSVFTVGQFYFRRQR